MKCPKTSLGCRQLPGTAHAHTNSTTPAQQQRDKVHPDLRSGQVLPFVPQGDAANKCDATMTNKRYYRWYHKNYVKFLIGN